MIVVCVFRSLRIFLYIRSTCLQFGSIKSYMCNFFIYASRVSLPYFVDPLAFVSGFAILLSHGIFLPDFGCGKIK